MSLYGNIASTAPFQFDRIFSSRTEMDQKLAPTGQFVDDGVFVGRYVLVKYSTQVNSVPVAIVKSDDYDKLQKAVKGETVEPFVLEQGGTTIKISATDSRVVVGTLFAVAPIDTSSAEHYPRLANKYFFFVCVGADEQTHEAKFDLMYTQDEYHNQSTGEYAANYNLDYANYGDQQGFDGTIWMKTYASVDDKYVEQYIQVGSINSSMPRLKVTPEAPTDKNQWRIPHLKTEGNVYDLHIQPTVGLRVGKTIVERVNKIGLDGQILNDTCPSTIADTGKLSSDCANKDSIYFNKAGFNDSVSYHDDARPNEISVELTGQSGQIYQSCTTGETGVEKDIYELRMSLPALGNSVATMWDLAYGTNRNKNIAWEDGSVVNRPGERLYKMKDGGYGYNTESVKSMAGCINSLHDLMGMIIITKNKENENDPDVINANNTFTNFGYENIYYFPNKKKYYRLMKKPQIEGKNQLSGDDYKYTGFTVSPDTYVAGLYYNDANGNSAANDASISDEKTLYKRSLSDKGLNKVYNEIPNAEMGEITNESIYHAREHGYYLVNDLNNIIEGNKYCVLKVDLAEITSYIPGVYYKKDPSKPNAGYQLDLSETASNTSYYKMVTLDGSDKYDIDISRNWVGEYPSGEEYRYYYTDEIVRKSVKKLQEALGTDLPIKGDNVFFKYDNATGIYQPYDETADVCYIGLRWKPTIDWDDDSKQFIQIQYPTEWIPVTLIKPAAQSIYYYDPALGYKEFDIDHYVSDFVNYVAGKYSEVSTISYVYRQFDPVSFDAGHDTVYYADGYGNYLKAEKPLAAGIMYYTVKETKTFKYVYEPNKYYYKSGNEYRLDSAERKTSGRTYYTLSEIVVADDTKGYYPVNSLWNVKIDLIPPSVTLATLSYQPQLVEMESFAEQMNTAHGLLLKINNVLESENTLTRSMNTVKGALNQVKDLLSKFDIMNPGDVVMVDGYGRLNSAEFGSSSWIKPVVKPDPEKPVVTFEHAGPAADGVWATPVITEDNNKQSVVLSVKVDTKGHIDSSNLKGVEPGNLLFTVHGVTRSFAEWITWAANQGGGGSSAVVTDWIASDPSALNFAINQGRLRDNDGTDTEDIWTLSTNIDTSTQKALQIATIASQAVTLAQTSYYNSLLPANKQFKLTLGYHDNNKFSNGYTATTVNTKVFDIDMREGLAALNLTQGTKLDQNLFTPQVTLDSKARCVEVKVYLDTTVVASAEIAPANYIVGTAINLDTLFENKSLNANTSYKVAFKAISNNDAYKDSAVQEFDYAYKAGLPAPVLSVGNYLKEPGALEAAGQLLTWTAVTSEGVTDIKYILKKNGTTVTTDPVTTLEYLLLKANASSANELNGTYTVFAQGKYGEDTLTSAASNIITVDWFQQLATPEISVSEELVGVTINWSEIEHAKAYHVFKDANSYPFIVVASDELLTCDLPYNGSYRVMASAEGSYQYFDSGFSDSIAVTNGSDQATGVNSNLAAAVKYQAVTGASYADIGASIDYKFGPETTLVNGMSIPSAAVSLQFIEQTTADGEIIYGGWNGYVGGFKVPTTIITSDGESHTLTKILVNGSEFSGAVGTPFTVDNVLQGKEINYYSWNGTKFTAVWGDNVSEALARGLTIDIIYDNVHDWKQISEQEVNCGRDGTITYQCTDGPNATCSHSAGNPGTKTVITATATGNHKWGEWTIEKPASETETGIKTKICEECGKTVDEDIPMISAHEYSTEWSTSADQHWHKCLKHPDDTNDVSDLGNHGDEPDAYTFIDWTNHKVSCGTCGFFMANAIHDWENNICSQCKADRTTHEHGFTASDWIIDVPPTTTTVGSKHRTCKICGYTETAECYALELEEMATPVLVNESTNDTCKFHFEIDPNFANDALSKYYYCTFYSNGTEIPRLYWNYVYNDGTFTVTIDSGYFTMYNTAYNITAIAHDQRKVYQDSGRSNSITFTPLISAPSLNTVGTTCQSVKLTFDKGTNAYAYGVLINGAQAIYDSSASSQTDTGYVMVYPRSSNNMTDDDATYTFTVRAIDKSGNTIGETATFSYCPNIYHGEEVKTAATCARGTIYQCPTCKREYDDGVMNPDNHAGPMTHFAEDNEDGATHNSIEHCNGCGKNISSIKGNHDWANENGKCSECPATHTHSFREWNVFAGYSQAECSICGYCKTCYHPEYRALSSGSSDEANKHLRECTTCGHIYEEDHTWGDYDDSGKRTCAVCGYANQCSHPAAKRNYNANGDGQTHTVGCGVCGATVDESEKCTAGSGSQATKCTRCGQPLTIA